ncbi:DNA-binding response regulator [uncultured Winogradskyella sp.]|uniref:DNA-binding response regulator n=1 Tax=uncultured Winogradskyella sp. TaxID=395353 RepID=UPI0035134304
MYNRVLVVDDHDAILHSIGKILDVLGVNAVDAAQYCDEAYLKYKRAKLDEAPYDLIITDLSFKKDHRTTKLESGEDLIEAIRPHDDTIKIIVYSMNDHLQKVRYLIDRLGVNGYVCKDRKGSKELLEALKLVKSSNIYLSPQIREARHNTNNLEIEDYDITLLKLLSKGKSQEEISQMFKSKSIKPSSLSSVEKRLNRLRIQFRAENVVHLVAQAKDLGLI